MKRNRTKLLKLLAVALGAVILLAAPCASGDARKTSFTDALGYPVTLERWDRVVSLYGSYAETWLLAGGTLTGTTTDAVEERGLALSKDIAIIGGVKTPNLEEILALEPDFVLLSADIAAQAEMHAVLSAAGIPHAYYRVDTLEEYLDMLKQFCGLTGREDLWVENGLAVEAQVQSVLDKTAGRTGPTVLLLRAYSTGVKAKGDDNLAGVILRDLGADNLVERYESLLEDLSMEEIIAADPEYIFVTTMGDEEKAMTYLREHVESDPAWAELRAVASGNCIALPRELFHYKPNARWGESYACLAKILYPDLDF